MGLVSIGLRFPVIANKCNFELWFVSAWLVGLGVGLMQVLVRLDAKPPLRRWPRGYSALSFLKSFLDLLKGPRQRERSK